MREKRKFNQRRRQCKLSYKEVTSQWGGSHRWGLQAERLSPLGFPCGSAGKESACSVGDLGLIPGLGRSPGEGKGYPLQYSGLENSIYSIDCIVHGVAKSQTRLSDFHFTSGRGGSGSGHQQKDWLEFYRRAFVPAVVKILLLPPYAPPWLREKLYLFSGGTVEDFG